ncbi:MAG: hypothetical protein IKJ97_03555 [Bacteroidaceae bacterium]|nr:hypothetical protein [Bacteroidaceae bacterium]
MKAQTIISLQITSIIIMAGTATMIFKSDIATILFILSFIVFIRCSIYIEKNKKRLLRENENDR